MKVSEAEYQQLLARPGAAPRAADPVAAGVFPVPRANAAPVTTDRYRSKTERLYALTILDVGVASGLLKDYWYEPMKGLWLAPKTSYTPDFLVQYTDPTQLLELHEVKGGFVYAKDFQKTKMAAAKYGCYRFILAQWKNQHWWFKNVPHH
jgi:hypothetical protein